MCVISPYNSGCFGQGRRVAPNKFTVTVGGDHRDHPCPVQAIFNRFKKFLDGRIIRTPLPEDVHLLAENFPYWIKLENRDPSKPANWVPSRVGEVLPLLRRGVFNQTGFRFDWTRANELFAISHQLESPNCIHRNLRHHQKRGQGGIRGEHIYVVYYKKKRRKVAFTIHDPRIGKVVLVSSFYTNSNWVRECVETPAIFSRPGSGCDCK